MIPALRNVPYDGDQRDLDLASIFGSEAGKRELARLREGGAPEIMYASAVWAAIDRVRKHCGTGSLTPG